MNQAAPIDKAALNAAMAAAPLTTVVRTRDQADATRPNHAVVNNGFRRMDVLTNEGRSWYQGVRASGRHQSEDLTLTRSYTLSKSEDRLNHWFAPEDSSDPELDRGPTGADTPHNFVASATWDLPGSGVILDGWRLSGVQHSQSGTPYSLRYTGNPTGTTLNQCTNRGCQVARGLAARNTERGAFINYTDVTLSRTFEIAGDRLEFRADAFNLFNNWNLISDGYVGIIGAANFGQHTGGLERLPGAAVPVRGHVSVLIGGARVPGLGSRGCGSHLSRFALGSGGQDVESSGGRELRRPPSFRWSAFMTRSRFLATRAALP